jgi:hypothetical protein
LSRAIAESPAGEKKNIRDAAEMNLPTFSFASWRRSSLASEHERRPDSSE